MNSTTDVPRARSTEVEIPCDDVRLAGTLVLPAAALGVVLFAHGSGSSRLSPRNRRVAEVLHEAGIGTLLFDLLSAAEDRDYATRFDIGLLTTRLAGATDWLAGQAVAASLPIGYFGASTGAAAALVAAAARGDGIAAAVAIIEHLGSPSGVDR
jgi:putative phosphoribosyl transferase